MNFLQLCQRARERCGMQGSGPAAVTGQVGEYLKLVNWVNESWLEIQNHWSRNEGFYWRWMRGSFSFTTVAGQQPYLPANFTSPVTDLRFYLEKSFRQYNTAAGVSSELFMTRHDYESFRDQYMFGAQPEAPPVDFCIDLADSSVVLNKPLSGYTITGQYVKAGAEMSANSDVPGMPAWLHMIIVYKTMMKYGIAKAAQEVYAEGKNANDEWMAKLISDQCVQLEDAQPLVL